MLKRIFSRSSSFPSTNKPLVVVSGLPRSGTSMMMRMLSEGGLELTVDSLRSADEDNPNGYFEIELSKKLTTGEKQWLYLSQGRAVKIISYLLEFLPDDLTYNIIFMERDIAEVLASQKKMLVRRSEQTDISDEQMSAQFNEHVRAVKYWVARKPNMRVLYVKYRDVMNSASTVAASITEFLELPLNIEAMQAVPNQSLYRNRSQE
jgi:hypothetical protein